MSLLPVLTTLLVLLVIGGVLFAVLVRVRRQRQELEAHLRLVAQGGGQPGRHDRGAITGKPLGWQSVLANAMRRWFTVGLPHRWGMRAGPLVLCVLAVGGACMAWLLLRAGLQISVPIAGVATAAAFLFAPRAWLKHEQNKAEQQFMTLFPDTIDMTIRMLRAGLPVTAAIRAVGNEAAPPVNHIFATMADRMGIGVPFEDALALAAVDLGLHDFSFFATAISLQRATGGNLATTLDILSDIMRKRRAMRLKARAVTGEVRMSAYVLGAMPFLVIGALLVVSPGYMRPLFTDSRGNVILGMAATSLIVGFGTIRQMMRSVTNV